MYDVRCTVYEIAIILNLNVLIIKLNKGTKF